jgi:hypothetical protein
MPDPSLPGPGEINLSKLVDKLTETIVAARDCTPDSATWLAKVNLLLQAIRETFTVELKVTTWKPGATDNLKVTPSFDNLQKVEGMLTPKARQAGETNANISIEFGGTIKVWHNGKLKDKPLSVLAWIKSDPASLHAQCKSILDQLKAAPTSTVALPPSGDCLQVDLSRAAQIAAYGLQALRKSDSTALRSAVSAAFQESSKSIHLGNVEAGEEASTTHRPIIVTVNNYADNIDGTPSHRWDGRINVPDEYGSNQNESTYISIPFDISVPESAFDNLSKSVNKWTTANAAAVGPSAPSPSQLSGDVLSGLFEELIAPDVNPKKIRSKVDDIVDWLEAGTISPDSRLYASPEWDIQKDTAYICIAVDINSETRLTLEPHFYRPNTTAAAIGKALAAIKSAAQK